jgi:cellulose synthase/poly-beta-1,6-N-acetylglucosamine synthase-like glycosyltransferase
MTAAMMRRMKGQRGVCRSIPQVKVYTKPNGGKASALNYGISRSEAEFVICIDADTKLVPNAISRLVMHFGDNKGYRAKRKEEPDKLRAGALSAP